MKTLPCPRCNGTGRLPDDTAIGKEMRRLRQAKNLSGREMARKLGASPAYLSDLELGRRHWHTEILRRFKSVLSENQ